MSIARPPHETAKCIMLVMTSLNAQQRVDTSIVAENIIKSDDINLAAIMSVAVDHRPAY